LEGLLESSAVLMMLCDSGGSEAAEKCEVALEAPKSLLSERRLSR
jgi:hypothetical protein